MRRIAFYSYDEHGLGHVRRSIAIAHALSAAEPVSILLIAGAREAPLFRLPEGTDTLALPAPGTDFNGVRRGPSIGLDMAGTVRMRARTLRSALAAYRPDVLIVDRLPLGVYDELAASLGLLREMGTGLVLGLRDVLDDPDYVRAEWDRAGALGVLRRSYDAVWVYGDPRVFDPADEYDLPADVREMLRYTGYLERHATGRPTRADLAARRRELDLPDGRIALCVLGGGEEGGRPSAGPAVAGPAPGSPRRSAAPSFPPAPPASSSRARSWPTTTATRSTPSPRAATTSACSTSCRTATRSSRSRTTSWRWAATTRSARSSRPARGPWSSPAPSRTASSSSARGGCRTWAPWTCSSRSG